MTPRTLSIPYLAALPALLLVLNCSSGTDSSPSDGAIAGGGAGGSGTSGAATAGSSSPTTGGAGSGTMNAGSGGGGAGHMGGQPGSGGSGTAGTTSTGGTLGSSGGPAQGGAGAGGRSNGGGASNGGTAGSGGGTNPDDKTISMTIPTPSNGQGEIRNSTTVLKNAQNGGKDVWDFSNQKIGVNNTSDCDSGEGQVTVFEVEDGVTVRNLIIAGGLPAGNGIVCKGNCTLEYVYWEDICEDAATNSKDGATMTLNHVIALHATDKVFQHNAKSGSKTILQNSYVSDFGKLWRSCGDCDSNGGPRHLVIDNVRIDGVKTAVAGANQNYGDTATIKNLFVKSGYNAGQDTPKICTEYLGVTDHNGESTKLNDGKSQWNTATCKVSQSDVKSY